LKERIDIEYLIKVNKIIERERKSSTYKLALLKSTILAIRKFDHLIEKREKEVSIPLGLVVEDWFFTYLPFVIKNIAQQNNRRILNKEIEKEYKKLLSNFRKEKDWKTIYFLLHQFYYSERNVRLFVPLFKKIARTIKDLPMKHIGDTEYEIFKPEAVPRTLKFPKDNLSRETLIKAFGTFTIPKEFYLVLRYLGQSIYGLSTLISKWKEITYKLNPPGSQDEIEEILSGRFFVDRDTSLVRDFLPYPIICVWTGKKLRKYHIDHIIPYSVLFNNDFWNLLPTSPQINIKKSNKIPTPESILKSRDNILYYWESYHEKVGNLFISQLRVALGEYKTFNDYIDALCEKAEYLINDLGFEPWEVGDFL